MGTIRPSLRRPRPIEIVLALSLAFNIFIVGGFAMTAWRFGPHMPASPEKRMEHLVRAIGMNPTKAPAYQQLRTNLRVAFDDMRTKAQPLADSFWVELAKPQPDMNSADKLMAGVMANREEFQRQAGSAVLGFVSQLTPEQRAAFIRIVNDRRNGLGQPMRMLLGN
ncbi:MAG TPA: periplasmic heavy metal sensor [Stellaceae bacterium]|nr:periplasmic heavy metal sensor [Stellaceae bacterium]